MNYRELRGTAAQRGYDARWRKARDLYIQDNPICAQCMLTGRIVKAYAVDHIRPHRGDQDLFWDESNWQSLCRQHHNQKSGQEAFTDKAAVKGCGPDGMPLDPNHFWNRG